MVGAIEEIGARTWRVTSRLGERNVHQYVLAGGDGDALLIDAGTARTPHETTLPALRKLGIASDDVAVVVVTHPDLDHQGGLAALRDELPRALVACGFADVPLVSDPEALVQRRYGAYEALHGLGFSPAEQRWQRALYGAPVVIDLPLAGGEDLRLGDRAVRVLHAPGHSAGHVIIHEPATGLLFTSDAIHGRMIPAADGRPALPPTYEEIDPYLGTIELVRVLAPAALHSGHWPAREGDAIDRWLNESLEFVGAVEALVVDRLSGAPATLRELCERVDHRLGPFGADPVNLRFAVAGHVRRAVREGRAALVDTSTRPARYVATEPVPPDRRRRQEPA